MPEILFRGKDVETGTWYQGYYLALADTTYCLEEDYAAHPENTKHYIVFDEMTDWGLPNRHLRADVDPATVGQYTGLLDRYGKKIFDGDIVSLSNRRGGDSHLRKAYLVERDWADGYWMCNPSYDPVVVGNIYDNPELLDVEQEG